MFKSSIPRLAGVLLAAMLAGCGHLTSPDEGHRPTIGIFDTYAGTDSILVVWDTGNYPHSISIHARRRPRSSRSGSGRLDPRRVPTS
jgi:hypothetical protein